MPPDSPAADRQPGPRSFREILHELLNVERALAALLRQEDEKLTASAWMAAAKRMANMDDAELVRLDRRVRAARMPRVDELIAAVVENVVLSPHFTIPPASLRGEPSLPTWPAADLAELGIGHPQVMAIASARAARQAPKRFGTRPGTGRDHGREVALQRRRQALRHELEHANDLGHYIVVETRHVAADARAAGLARLRLKDFPKILLAFGWVETLTTEALDRGLPPGLIWNPANGAGRPRPKRETCIGCGTPLTGAATRWCSRRCAREHERDARREKTATRRAGMTCKGCGAPMIASRADRIFCSQACGVAHRLKSAPLRSCAWCGCQFKRLRTIGVPDPVCCCKSHGLLFGHRQRAQAAAASAAPAAEAAE